jgi:hypothetical protein
MSRRKFHHFLILIEAVIPLEEDNPDDDMTGCLDLGSISAINDSIKDTDWYQIKLLSEERITGKLAAATILKYSDGESTTGFGVGPEHLGLDHAGNDLPKETT